MFFLNREFLARLIFLRVLYCSRQDVVIKVYLEDLHSISSRSHQVYKCAHSLANNI